MAEKPFNPEMLVEQMQALGQSSRFSVLRLLARYAPFGLGAGDIARLIAVPHNTLSTHLSALEHAGLVRSRKEGRRIVYALEGEAVEAMLAQLAGSLAPKGRQEPRLSVPVVREAREGGPVYTVLVLCTHNSARSIMAEALINREGQGRFRALSAGARPKGTVDGEVIRLLSGLGYDVSAFHSKGWDALGGDKAPPIDFLITVCDDAAGEKCPLWPGHPLAVHWGIPDPTKAGTRPAEHREAVLAAYRQLSARVTAFVNLPIETLTLDELKAELIAIGHLEGATRLALAQHAA